MNALDELLTRAVRVGPDRPALMDEEGRVVTYRALNAATEALLSRLHGLELKAGERVALLSRNSASFVAGLFAVWRSKGVAVPLNCTWKSDELVAAIQDSGARVVFFEQELRGKLETESLNSKIKVFFEPLDHVGGNLTGGGGGAPQSARSPELVEGRGRLGLPPTGPVKFPADNHLAMIVYTSGSTDRSLGVMLTHRNLLSNNLAIADYLKLTPEDRVCCVLPLYYIYGLSLLLSHVAAGACVILDNRFLYPQTVLDSMEKSEATGFSGVSSHFITLMNQTDFLQRQLPKLRYFTHAGDKMPPSVAQKVAETFPDKQLFLMYGQTEAAPRISFLDPWLVLKKPASAGRPLPGIKLEILGEDGRPCAAGEEGEIAIRGENVMAGYWNNPEETAKVLREGRLHTGDIGHLDADGDLYVTGRKKQFFKIGGRRVSPLEIESLTLQFGGVCEAAAVGIPDETLGERLKVCISESSTGAVDRQALMEFYRKHLPLHKIPLEMEVWPALPKNDQGKVDKKKLAPRMNHYISFTQIVDHLDIQEKGCLLVSSDVLGLAVAAKANGEVFDPNAFIDSFLRKLGKEGTLLFPTFNFDFCDKGEFDIRTTPSLTGALSRAALKRPDFQRTRHPIHSFAVTGRYKGEFCGLQNKSSFGPGSPFDFLYEHDGQMLIIGTSYQGSFTFVHYVEEKERTGYRFLKEFEAFYVDENGRMEKVVYSMFVRDVTRGVESWVEPIGLELEERRIAVSRQINGISFKEIRLVEAYEVIAQDIRQNGGKKLYRITALSS